MKHTPQHKALMKVVNEEKVPRAKGVVYKKAGHFKHKPFKGTKDQYKALGAQIREEEGIDRKGRRVGADANYPND